jgi:hypothetical protein
MTVYHDYEPNSTFFGFYHRREFDKGTLDPVTGKNIDQTTLDKTRTSGKHKSPVTINPTYENEGLLETPSILSTLKQTVKNSIDNFQFNFNALSAIGVRVSDLVLKDKAKRAMQSFMNLTSVLNDYRILMGGSPNGSKTIPLLPDQQPSNSIGVPNTVSINPSTNLNPLKTDISGNLTNNVQSLTSNITNIMGEAQSGFNKLKTQIKNADEIVENFNVDSFSDGVKSTIKVAQNATTIKTIGDIIQDAKSRKPIQPDNSKDIS